MESHGWSLLTGTDPPEGAAPQLAVPCSAFARNIDNAYRLGERYWAAPSGVHEDPVKLPDGATAESQLDDNIVRGVPA